MKVKKITKIVFLYPNGKLIQVSTIQVQKSLEPETDR